MDDLNFQEAHGFVVSGYLRRLGPAGRHSYMFDATFHAKVYTGAVVVLCLLGMRVA